ISSGAIKPWGVEAPIAGIRGVPSKGAVFEHNCVARTDGKWVEQSTMKVHSTRQSGKNCYEKKPGKWLCSTPAHGANMKGITVRNNRMGKATGCRGYPYKGAFADDDGHPLEAHINEVAKAGIVSGCSKFP